MISLREVTATTDSGAVLRSGCSSYIDRLSQQKRYKGTALVLIGDCLRSMGVSSVSSWCPGNFLLGAFTLIKS